MTIRSAGAYVLSLLISWSALVEPARAEPFQFATSEPFGAFSGQDLPEGGLATRIFRDLLTAAGIDFEIVWTAGWTEAENGAREQRFAGTFPYYYTLTRSLDFVFSDAVLSIGERFYTAKDGPTIEGLGNVKGQKLCYPQGYGFPTSLQLRHDAGDFERITPDDMPRCFELLASGQTDVVLSDQLEANEIITFSETGPSGVVESPFDVSNRTMHLILSHNHDSADEIIKAFNDALSAARQRGDLAVAIAETLGDVDILPSEPEAFRQDAAVDGLIKLRDGVERKGRVREVAPGRYEIATDLGSIEYARSFVDAICPVTGCEPAGDGQSFGLVLHGSNTVGARLAPVLLQTFVEREGAVLDPWKLGDAGERQADVSEGPPDGIGYVEVAAHGSSTGFVSLEDKTADIAMSSRPINEDEHARLLRAGLGDVYEGTGENVIALDGVAVIVHPQNPVRTLTLDSVRDIFSGRITSWSTLGGGDRVIKVYARDDKSGTWDTFRSLALRGSAIADDAERYESSFDLADAVAADPDAIGFVGLPYTRNARALDLRVCDATHPASAFAVKAEEYPLARRLYFYTPPATTNPFVGAFAAFAEDEGQEVVRGEGFIDLEIGQQSADERLAFASGAASITHQRPGEVRDFFDRVRDYHRLSVTFRFRLGSSELDGRALEDIERLARFLDREENQGRRLQVIGFADNRGDWAFNRDLSEQRAREVAAALRIETKGLHDIGAFGLSEELPVACNAADGYALNRRVEVWISG